MSSAERKTNMATFMSIFLFSSFLHLCVASQQKRILMSDPNFAQDQIHSLQLAIQKLETEFSEYKTKLSTCENHISTQQLQVAAQENKILQQEQKLTEQENRILDQQATIQNITKNLTDVMYHNFFDEMAQSMCASVVPYPAYVYAIRRDCGGGKGKGPTCNHICAAAAPAIQSPNMHVSCYDAFSIQKVHQQLLPNPGAGQTDAGKPFMDVFRYHANGCTFPADICGPNYCCCQKH